MPWLDHGIHAVISPDGQPRDMPVPSLLRVGEQRRKQNARHMAGRRG